MGNIIYESSGDARLFECRVYPFFYAAGIPAMSTGGLEITGEQNKRAALVVKGLSKVYHSDGKSSSVLDQLSCRIYENEAVAVVGASGVGKTTFLHLIGTLDRPSEGKILHFGQDVFSWSDQRLSWFRSRQIGFVFQFHHLLAEFSAVENVMMPCLVAGKKASHARHKAEELLAFLGLEDKAEENVKHLSGGEQQRVALARALVRRPRLILADEPTGNLDEKSGLKVADLLFQMKRHFNATVIIVTHNLNLARRTDRCIGLKAGKALEIEKDRLADFVMEKAA